MAHLRFVLFLLALCLARPVAAQLQITALAPSGPAAPLLQQGRPLVGDLTRRGDHPAPMSASLFAGQKRGGMFAPIARKRPDRTTLAPYRPGPFSTAAERIRHIIARAEAGRAGYDAVQHGARIRPPKRPTHMTLAEIDTWIRATPGQPHAIGRYQFIPPTLRNLIRRARLPYSTRFTPQVQDRLADLLLDDAGLDAAQKGEISRTAFMNNLSKIWAGLPNSSGRSHYHGYAGNKATMTWARFEREMATVFPG